MAKETVCIVNPQNLNVPIEKIEIYHAFELLEKENVRLLQEKGTGSCTVCLYDKKDSLLFSEDLQFPLSKDIEVVLTELLLSTQKQQKPKLNKSRLKVEKAAKQQKQTKRTKVKKRNKRHTIKLNKRYWLFMVIGCSLLLVGFVGFKPATQAFSMLFVTKQATEKSWADYLKEKNFLQAAEKFPEKRGELVSFLAEQKKFKELEQVNESFPTEEGTFDLAFYQEDWEKVITLKGSILTKDRQVMLAHAYIQLGKLKEAEIMNRTIKSELLKEELLYSYKVKAIQAIQSGNIKEAEAINSTIKDDDLGELITTGKTCIEMIEHFKKEKDAENQQLWTKHLENLGGEFITNEIKRDDSKK